MMQNVPMFRPTFFCLACSDSFCLAISDRKVSKEYYFVQILAHHRSGAHCLTVAQNSQ